MWLVAFRRHRTRSAVTALLLCLWLGSPGTPQPMANEPLAGASTPAKVCDTAGNSRESLNAIRQLSFDRGGRHGTGCMRLAAEAALRRCAQAAHLGFASGRQTPGLIAQPVRDAGSAVLSSPPSNVPRIAPQHPISPNWVIHESPRTRTLSTKAMSGKRGAMCSRIVTLATALAGALLVVSACGSRDEPQSSAPDVRGSPTHLASASDEKVVNVYNWVDYIEPTLLEKFTAETGIKVIYERTTPTSSLKPS